MDEMNTISSRGYACGYFGAVLCLLICVGVSVSTPIPFNSYRINILISGVWWLAFSGFTFAWLRPRPGPPLPKGESYLLLPWKDLYTTFSRAKDLKHNFSFLVAWFIYSDGFSTINSIGAQYANTNINWQPLSRSLGLAGMLLIVPITASLGNIWWLWAQKRFKLTNAQVLTYNNIGMALIPAYGLTGVAHRALGFRRWWDIYIGVAIYGFNLGSVQSMSRAVYGAMIPEGQESRFFSLYSFTDRGSSWIGPAVTAAILQATGSMRLAFAYPLAALMVPLPLLVGIDYVKAEHEAKAYAAKYHTASIATRGNVSVVGHEKEAIEEMEHIEAAEAAAHAAAAAARHHGAHAPVVSSQPPAQEKVLE